MQDTKYFDILVCYTSRAAYSASSLTRTDLVKPFGDLAEKRIYNEAYAYFLKTCTRVGVRAAFTTSKDLNKTGDGFTSYWLYQKNEWIKVNEPCYSSLVFDKFFPITDRQKFVRQTLFSNGVEPFNNPLVYNMFFDKLETYKNLKDFAIPTVNIETRNSEGVKKALRKLKWLISRHPNKKDFNGKLVLKDRFGLSGKRIYSFESGAEIRKIVHILKAHKNNLFLLQPFVNFRNGYSYKRFKGFIDIRAVHINNEIVQTYLRIAPRGDFRCNEHLGGTLKYIPKKDLPKKVLRVCSKIVKKLGVKSSLFALDFIISDNAHVYLMEGNCGPGLDWNLKLRKNELEAKRYIRAIVNHIKTRIKRKNLPKNQTRYDHILPVSHQ